MAMYRFSVENNTTSLNKESLESKFKVKLTKMEFQILQLIWQGKSNQTISAEIFLSINTIKTHVRNLFEKFNTRTRNELMVLLR